MMLATDAHHDRMGGKGKGRQLRRVLAQQARIFARRRFRVDLAHRAVARIGLGHHHAAVGWHQMVQAEDLDAAIAAHHRQHGGVAQRAAPVEHEGFLEPCAIPRRSAEQRHRTQPRGQRPGQLVFADRQTVDQQKGKLVLPVRPCPDQALTDPDQLADQRLRVEIIKIRHQQRFCLEMRRGQCHRHDLPFGIAAAADLACRGAAHHRRVGKDRIKPGGQRRHIGQRRDEQDHQRKGPLPQRLRQRRHGIMPAGLDGRAADQGGAGRTNRVCPAHARCVHSVPPRPRKP